MGEMACPSGTVTFVFTDVEGSTRLWEEHPLEMRAALARHDEILRAVIEGNGGYIFSTAGDAFSAAFARAGDAVCAAAEAQDALGAEAWPPTTPIRVRIGVHTGEAQERGGDYFGPVVNRAARIMSAGHGGQVLISDASVGLVSRDDLVALGEYRLKDLQGRERLWQLGRAVFPPLHTLDAMRHNLPVRRVDLVGRESELARVGEALAAHRLVTLTGMGGVGKTSLAVTAAALVADRFPDGVFLVELARLSDEHLVVRAIGEAAGMRLASIGEQADRAVISFLADRRVLLVLDNCEHLIDAAADATDCLLGAGRCCRVLATSRESLEVDGEQVIRVGPLSTEAAVSLLSAKVLGSRPDFDPIGKEVEALVEICKRLDGIPLALELASAQLAHLSPLDLVSRLEDRFSLLAAGRGSRRRTLAAMVDWSWDLLENDEQTLLAALSVFTGGSSLPAAQGVCGQLVEASLVGLLGRLHAKSLVTRADTATGVRYGLLETVRLYASQRLAEFGRSDEIQERHAEYWSATAVPVAFPDWEAPSDLPSVCVIRCEMDNVRQAVNWLIDRGRAAEAIGAVGLIAQLWQAGFLPGSCPVEDLLERALDAELDDRHRAYGLIAMAHLRWADGNFEAVGAHAQQALALAMASSDHAAAAAACWLHSLTWQIRDPERALGLLARAEEHAVRAGLPVFVRCARGFASLVHSFGLRNPDTGEAMCREVLAEAPPDGYDRLVAITSLLVPLYLRGDWAAALEVHRLLTDVLRRSGSDHAVYQLVEQAVLAVELGHEHDATARYRAAYEANEADGTPTTRAEHLLVPLGRAVRNGEWNNAARLVATIRALSRGGVELGSPGMVAIYLHYREAVTHHGIDIKAVEPYQAKQVIEHQLTGTGNEFRLN